MLGKTIATLLDNLKRIPAKLWLRVALLGAVLATGAVLIFFTPLGEYFTQENMIALLEELRSSPATPFLLMGAFMVVTPLGFIPVSPLVLGGGVVFGAFWGSVYNILGMLLGAMVGYWVAKLLGRDFVVQLAGDKLKRAEKVFERQGFWPLVQVRFLPIPFAIISYAAALAGVGASRFLITTALGLIPATVIHTYFGPKLILEGDRGITGILYVSSFVAFNVLVSWPSIREQLRRRRRYRELLEERARRQEAQGS